jgi:hypothetical protein
MITAAEVGLVKTRELILKWILGATPRLPPSLEPSIRTVGMSPCRDQLRRGFLLYVIGKHSSRALAFPESLQGRFQSKDSLAPIGR